MSQKPDSKPLKISPAEVSTFVDVPPGSESTWNAAQVTSLALRIRDKIIEHDPAASGFRWRLDLTSLQMWFLKVDGTTSEAEISEPLRLAEATTSVLPTNDWESLP